LPQYSGRMLWRATTVAPPYLSGASMIMAGHQDQKFVAYPIAPPGHDGRVLVNWIAELKWPHMIERENWNRLGQLDHFLPKFESWRFDWLDIPALIGGAEAVYEFPMVDRDPLPRWRHGRISLLGDAAHPMYPIGSNGASQAILDGQTLARVLRETSDPIEALTRYEDARRPATAAIVHANRGNGPEICMQIAHERAPDGFAGIESVIPRSELEEIAAHYKRLAGFDPKLLGARG
jgi:5-methylphenazine-1-carboxylate 1-monooxygenase